MDNKTFTYNGINFTEGDAVKVSRHYACYKNQYPFMVGVVYLNHRGIPYVKIAINPKDSSQTSKTQLKCWGVVEKIK